MHELVTINTDRINARLNYEILKQFLYLRLGSVSGLLTSYFPTNIFYAILTQRSYYLMALITSGERQRLTLLAMQFYPSIATYSHLGLQNQTAHSQMPRTAGYQQHVSYQTPRQQPINCTAR